MTPVAFNYKQLWYVSWSHKKHGGSEGDPDITEMGA